MDSARTLDYQARESRPHRLWRRAWKVTTILGIVAAGFFWGPGIFRWSEFMYWQHRCMTYAAPADHVVAEWDLIDYSNPQKCEISPLQAHYFNTWTDTFNINCGATILVHEMRAPNGESRLTFVGLESSDPRHKDIPDIFDESLPLLRKPPTMSMGESATFDFSSLHIPPEAKHIQVFAGQLDPTNPSHFTFDYSLDGTRHTVDGWIVNSGKIQISARP